MCGSFMLGISIRTIQTAAISRQTALRAARLAEAYGSRHKSVQRAALHERAPENSLTR